MINQRVSVTHYSINKVLTTIRKISIAKKCKTCKATKLYNHNISFFKRIFFRIECTSLMWLTIARLQVLWKMSTLDFWYIPAPLTHAFLSFFHFLYNTNAARISFTATKVGRFIFIVSTHFSSS